MTGRRSRAVAVALLLAALAAPGCGFGPGEGVGEVELVVTRDYGSQRLAIARDEVSESDTVMRVLDRNVEIDTSYGGGFVQAIDGLAAERSGTPSDWLYYVNGVEATVGAADYELHGGETIWWDYRDWSAALRVPAVVGSWPHPFLAGYDGRQRDVAVECLENGRACAGVRGRLERAGTRLAADAPEGAIRVLVGTWAEVREDAAAAQLEDGPESSGVFVDLRRGGDGFELLALDERGGPGRALGVDAGLVAATQRYGGPPVWVVTGGTAAAVAAAAELLDEASLRNHYAVAIDGGEEIPLPLG